MDNRIRAPRAGEHSGSATGYDNDPGTRTRCKVVSRLEMQLRADLGPSLWSAHAWLGASDAQLWAVRWNRPLEGVAQVTHGAISVSQAINFAWPTFKQRFGLFAGILLTIAGAWVALEMVVVAGQRFGIVWWAVAHLVFLVFVAAVQAGFLHAGLVLYDGGEPTFADTFRHLALGPGFLAGQVAYGLLVVAGLLLLVIPGLYLGARYALFGFCLASGEADVIQSFGRSALLSAGARTTLLGILAALLVLNVLGASLLGLGLFLTIPLTVLILTAVYRQLSPR